MSLANFQSEDMSLNLMQDSWSTILNPIIDNPINKANILKNITLINGTTVVNHLLSRKLQGWFIVGINAAATIYDNQKNNQTTDKTLILISNAAATVNIAVF